MSDSLIWIPILKNPLLLSIFRAFTHTPLPPLIPLKTIKIKISSFWGQIDGNLNLAFHLKDGFGSGKGEAGAMAGSQGIDQGEEDEEGGESDWMLGWDQTVGELRVIEIEGGHLDQQCQHSMW